MAKVHLALFHVINNEEDKALVINRGPIIQHLKIIRVPMINLTTVVTIVDHGTDGTAMTGTIDEMTIDEVIETAETDAEPSVIRMRARLRALL